MESVEIHKIVDIDQNLMNAEKLIENYYRNQEHDIDFDESIYTEEAENDLIYQADEYIDERFVPRNEFHLKKFFGLLTDQEFFDRYTSDEYLPYCMDEIFIDYETILVVDQPPIDPYKYQNSEIYFVAEKILIDLDLDFFIAYKIGETIDDCQFIGCDYKLLRLQRRIDEFIKSELNAS